MRRFKKILLVLGRGTKERASLRRALWLTRNNGALLTVASVVEGLSRDLRVLDAASPPGGLEALAREEALQSLQRVVGTAVKKADVHFELKVLSGTPVVEIIREVLRNRHDLVIHPAEGKGGFRELLFGSTTMRLMRKCPCPVWVVKPGRRRTNTRVLAAVAPSDGDESATALNRKILELATSLVALEGGALHIVHAWSLYGESILRGSARIPRGELDRLFRETLEQRKAMLAELLEPFALEKRKSEVHLLKGRPEEIVPRIVRAKGIDITVMGTLSRAGVAGLLIGNTAERILSQVDCSVLTVKPEGFVAPIELPAQEQSESEVIAREA